jgi:hypothetical protein
MILVQPNLDQPSQDVCGRLDMDSDRVQENRLLAESTMDDATNNLWSKSTRSTKRNTLESSQDRVRSFYSEPSSKISLMMDDASIFTAEL